MVLSSAWVFVATVSRFRFAAFNVFWLFNLVSVGLCTAATYHAPYQLWRFPVHWVFYTLIMVSANLLAAQFVLPLTAGNIIRSSLAGALNAMGAAFVTAIDLMTGEVDEATGLLKNRSGVSKGAMSVWDS